MPRWWGVEILDCRQSSVRLDRIKNSAPLLLNHDAREQVGVVEAVSLGADRVARARVRFSENGPAQAILRDVRSGIRQKVSVGYRIHDLEPTGRTLGGLAEYRVSDWEPFEISIVSIPADDTVGVGRSISSPEPVRELRTSARAQIMDRNYEEQNDPRTILSRRERRQAMAGELDNHDIEQRAEQHQSTLEERAEQMRASEIRGLGDMWPELRGSDLAREAVLSGMSPEVFRNVLRDKLAAFKSAPQTVTGRVSQSDTAAYGAGAREVLPGRLGPFQTERAAYGFGQFLRAQMPDGEQSRRWMRENFGEQRAISSTGAGGVLIPTEVSSELIKNLDSYGVARRESRAWIMSSQALTVPVNTSRPTASFTGPGIEADSSDPGFGEVGLSAKQLMSQVVVNRETMQDSVIDLASFVGQSLSEAFAYTEDSCLFNGDGTSTYGGLTGLPNALLAGSIQQAAAGHDTFPEIDLADVTNLMARLPSYALNESKWFCSSAFYAAAMLQSAVVAGGSSVGDIERGPDLTKPKFLGFPVIFVANMPSDPAATYNLGAPLLYFGAMRRAVAFGDRQSISLTVDPYTLAGKSQVRIVGYSRFDCVVHATGTASTAGAIVGLRGKT